MPLVVMCGLPGSGKTRKSLKIKKHLEDVYKKQVEIVSEEIEAEKAGFSKETLYFQSEQEKHLRSVLKSQVVKLLNKENAVILDGGNYIKGYRYELYCASKSVSSTQCTVYTLCDMGEAKRNTTLPSDVFTGLTDRFEEPNSNNRWDSPLVVWNEQDDGERDNEILQTIYSCLYQRAPPPPNLSTQNAPLSDSKFLQRLDEVTREVCERAAGGLLADIPTDPLPTPPQLSRLRRQFLTYAKMNLSNTAPVEIGRLFRQYLTATLAS